MNIFITGTDTDVGKTITSAWICKNTSASYFKPIQTGDDSDTNTVIRFSPQTQIIPNAYKLKAPLSAYDAARLEGVDIDIEGIKRKCPQNNTVIEGAGGALVPITKNIMMADLINLMNAKALIVAKSKLGFLNHIFLTVEALRTRNTDILGIILNGETTLINTVEHFSKCKVLATLTDLNAISSEPIPPSIQFALTL